MPAGQDPGTAWINTTHDWAVIVDLEHVADIRARPEALAPGGALHLLLEVLAYAADEAEACGGGAARVSLDADGSITVSDDGRGTDTRRDQDGEPVRKPVMASKDLRCFDAPDSPLLPDGRPRRGMSVVAALSDRLVHHNRRHDGTWTQDYRDGLPVTELLPVASDGTTGTTVTFWPSTKVQPSAADLDPTAWAPFDYPHLTVEVTDRRPG